MMGRERKRKYCANQCIARAKYLAKQQYLDDAISIKLHYKNWIKKIILHGLIT
jgi:hypothetical protein